MDILEPHPKKINGNKFVLVMKDCYLKLTRAVATSKAIASHTLSLHMNICIILYTLLTHLLTESGEELVDTFFGVAMLLLE